MQTVLIVVFSYLLGSVSFAIVVSRVLALPDPRSYGSGNPGATNVLRTGSKAAAALTLVGDAGKGWLAVWLATLASGAPATVGYAAPVAGLAVFCGHLFPVFYRFRGGKGVATAAGVLLALNAWLGLATLATWAIVVLFFRISSLAALAAALFAPFYAWWLLGLGPLLAAVVAIALLLAWRHRANIARLAAGKEPRLGAKRDAAPPA
ncbi:MAG TPA: glycerol-3-phosphate 1-O-acyltransferase PlsY [Burkholderiales bacterium]|nr:glycerol-3-phosphate 1-O-acyltransferase PlsY [Burkholderiales bacterium]